MFFFLPKEKKKTSLKQSQNEFRAHQDKKKLTSFFSPDCNAASTSTDMLSKFDKLLSWRGTTARFWDKLSKEKWLLPLALVLLLWSALSPISPASETASLSMKSSNCRGKENDMLKDRLLEELKELLRLHSKSTFWGSIVLVSVIYWNLETSVEKLENIHVTAITIWY